MTLTELQSGYLCGGESDPDNPDAEVIADTLMTLDEVISALRDAGDVGLYLDVKFDPDYAPPADRKTP